DRLWFEPEQVLIRAGYPPDRWQSNLLHAIDKQIHVLCARQVGKTLVAAALALVTACRKEESLNLITSPTLRQSIEVLERVKTLRRSCEFIRSEERATAMRFDNGSRILALPAEEKNIRGFASVSLLIVDEAARVPDELYYSIRPMLSINKGRIICLST